LRTLLPALLVVVLAACGGSSEEPSGVAAPTVPRDQVRLGGVAFKPGVGIAEAVQLAWTGGLAVDELIVEQRGGGEVLTGGMVPDPSKSPEEVEQAYLEDEGEESREDFSEEQWKEIQEAKRAKASVRDMTVCGTAAAIRSLRTDQRVQEVIIAPKNWAAECPGGTVDSSP
jgi:hypothetical protein